jgi:ketosteroid isomerase-like protein
MISQNQAADAIAVAAMMDKWAIRELTARYNHAFDDADPVAFAAQFTDDGVFDIVGKMVVEGREALEDTVRKIGYGVVHATTDATVSIDGDMATQTCTLLVVSRTRDGAKQRLLGTGRYQDDLIRTSSGWLFSRRRFFMDRDLLPDS